VVARSGPAVETATEFSDTNPYSPDHHNPLIYNGTVSEKHSFVTLELDTKV